MRNLKRACSIVQLITVEIKSRSIHMPQGSLYITTFLRQTLNALIKFNVRNYRKPFFLLAILNAYLACHIAVCLTYNVCCVVCRAIVWCNSAIVLFRFAPTALLMCVSIYIDSSGTCSKSIAGQWALRCSFLAIIDQKCGETGARLIIATGLTDRSKKKKT